MGLDTDIYRVNRKKAEAAKCVDQNGDHEYIDYWSINREVKSVCYQRQYWPLQCILEELTGRLQCEYYEITKLKAHHLLYVMQLNYKGLDVDERIRRDQFVKDFKELLHNFDWECDMLVWNWC